MVHDRLSESTERFLRAIADHVDPALVEEMHLFAPIRQGGKESGVAVIAARQPEQHADGPEGGDAPDAPDDSWLTTDPPLERDSDDDVHPNESDPGVGDGGDAPERDDASPSQSASRSQVRLTVYRASYRWTLKGIDRGKWEVEVVAEADAPLATIDEVVRGVTRRAGDANDAERLSGDDYRRAIALTA